MSTPCPFCGAYSTRSCEWENEDECPWDDVEHGCPDCGDTGIVVKCVQAYEPGCCVPHDDGDEIPCPSCRGPDPDDQRDLKLERRAMEKEMSHGE